MGRSVAARRQDTPNASIASCVDIEQGAMVQQEPHDAAMVIASEGGDVKGGKALQVIGPHCAISAMLQKRAHHAYMACSASTAVRRRREEPA